MGAAFVKHSIKPAWHFDDLPERFDFLRETTYWPMVHTLFPFTVYLYCRSWVLVMFLVFFNEFVEAVLWGAFYGTDFARGLDESRLDSLLGDIGNGAIACIMGELFLQVLDYPYYKLPYDLTLRNGLKTLLGRYIVQVLLLAAAWIGVPWLYVLDRVRIADIYHGHHEYRFEDWGHYSLGVTISLVWYPLMLYLTYLWNAHAPMFRRKKELHWRSMTPGNPIVSPDDIQDSYSMVHYDKGDALHKSPTEPANVYPYYLEHKWEAPGKQMDAPYDAAVRRMSVWWAIFVVAFQLSVFWRYTSTYVQVLLHSGLVIIIFSVVLIVRAAINSNKRRAKSNEA